MLWARRGDADDRRKVAESLRGPPGTEASLVALVADHDPAVKANAAWSLGHRGGEAAIVALTSALGDADAAVAGNAAIALAVYLVLRSGWKLKS